MVDLLWILKHKVLGRSHYYEQPVMDRLKRIRGEIFVDVGANIGRYSAKLARNFRTVHAFEPNPRYLSVLKDNIPPNVVVHEVALSDGDGSALLYLNTAGHGGSAETIMEKFQYNPADNPGAAHTFTGREEESLPVLTNRFDTIFPREQVDLVKIDVEGAEFLVLAGMRNSLKEQRVRNLVVELHNAAQAENLQSLLRGLGYWSVWLDPTHLYSWPSRL